MSQPIHLVRHGHVRNPDEVVYADLDGFPLSEAGRAQAQATAHHMAGRPLSHIVTSPVERALETATIIAEPHGITLESDERLTEWRLSSHWAGIPWAALPSQRPGELEAYLEHPWDLPFSPESLAAVAERMVSAVVEHHETSTGAIMFVAHQDPLQAARLALCGRSLRELKADKPDHASVVTLLPGDPWTEESYWRPDGAP